MAAPVSWIGERRGRWLGPGPAPSPSSRPEPPKPSAVPAARQAEEQYAVAYLPVRCPKCDRGDQVTTYKSYRQKSPPTRYHQCSRCGINFRSHEVEEGPDGRLLPRCGN